MNTDRLHRMLWGLLALAAVAIGYQAWQSAQNPAIVIEWETATEMDTAGFNVYRAPDPEGPFERVNDGLIPPAPDPLTGGEYTFTDHNVRAGQTYFYRLEEVESGGTSQVQGTVTARARRGGLWESALAMAVLITAAYGFFRSPKNKGGE